MHAVLQKEISEEELRQEIGDLPELAGLLQRIYDGRLSDRNRSIVVLAKHHGLGRNVIPMPESSDLSLMTEGIGKGQSSRPYHRSELTGIGIICAFLGISKKTYRKYLRIFELGGTVELFARQTKSSRKFDDETVKEAVFSLLHEPPSNYGINRTSWIMADFRRILNEKDQPICPEVIRKITKVAGYRWRKARVVLTSSDPAYSEKLDRIRTILSSLHPDEAFFSIDEYGPFAIKMKVASEGW
jgi:hypothetical protein